MYVRACVRVCVRVCVCVCGGGGGGGGGGGVARLTASWLHTSHQRVPHLTHSSSGPPSATPHSGHCPHRAQSGPVDSFHRGRRCGGFRDSEGGVLPHLLHTKVVSLPLWPTSALGAESPTRAPAPAAAAEEATGVRDAPDENKNDRAVSASVRAPHIHMSPDRENHTHSADTSTQHVCRDSVYDICALCTVTS
jgi:hypothetical protein